MQALHLAFKLNPKTVAGKQRLIFNVWGTQWVAQKRLGVGTWNFSPFQFSGGACLPFARGQHCDQPAGSTGNVQGGGRSRWEEGWGDRKHWRKEQPAAAGHEPRGREWWKEKTNERKDVLQEGCLSSPCFTAAELLGPLSTVRLTKMGKSPETHRRQTVYRMKT